MKKSEIFWTEKDGIIYFYVTSRGLTRQAWLDYLDDKNIQVTRYAEELILSEHFAATNGVKMKVAILKGQSFGDSQRTTKNVLIEATRLKFAIPNLELACLIREIVSEQDIKDMGLSWIVVAHEPIRDVDNDPARLGIDGEALITGYDGIDIGVEEAGLTWTEETGFAFVVVDEQKE